MNEEDLIGDLCVLSKDYGEKNRTSDDSLIGVRGSINDVTSNMCVKTILNGFFWRGIENLIFHYHDRYRLFLTLLLVLISNSELHHWFLSMNLVMH